MQNDMPTQPVHDLKIHPREHDLIAATHGRGIYITDVSPLAELTPAVMAQDAHFFRPESKVRWIADDRTNYSSSNFRGESEPEAVALYYYLGGGTLLGEEAGGEVTFTVYQGKVPVAEITGPGEPGLHKVLWRMDRRVERTESEIEQARRQAERFGREIDEEELRYRSEPAPEGEYTVSLTVGGREMRHKVSILRDQWWRERR